ncbi:uncharacterized protein LOC133799710 [Humulus lupulus]|uniref:uncharacterized protein LOC133799710 n=1 Tax=Humulus lupulus TaxID=3486 RepID=UPI002B40DBE1|nr:uncharacterized protein LOC133799710 [Humulus lupulus]
MGTRLKFITIFHPQSDGKSERTIKILEDMLRCCALDFLESPLHWDEDGEKKILGPEAIREASEAIDKIRQRKITAQSRQKSYAALKRRDIEFFVGKVLFWRVLPMKGVMRFGKKGELSLRFIGPFEILDRVGQVAYRLALPPVLAQTHNVFHISMLRKYVSNPSHVLIYESLQLKHDMSYNEQPKRIIEKQIKEL